MKMPRPGCVWLLGQQALREVVHLRIAWVLSAAIVVLIAGGALLTGFNFGAEEPRFLIDFAGGTLEFFGAVLAVLLTVTLVQGGSGTLTVLVVRGVRRSEWMLARLGAVWIALAWLVLAGCMALSLLLATRHHDVEFSALASFALGTLVRLHLIACFALFTASISRSALFAAVLALLLAIAAHLAPIIAWAHQHAGAFGRIGWTTLGWMVPDLAGLESVTLLKLLVAAVHALVYACAGCLIFSRREL